MVISEGIESNALDKKKKGKNLLIIIYFISIIPKLIVAIYSRPLVDIVDEMSTMSVAAFLAGLNWSGIISENPYYGFGYYFIFAPLFKTSLSILSIYKIINIVTVLLTSLVFFISYKMSDEFFEIKDYKIKVLLSILFSYISAIPVDRILNDHILILLVWLIAYVICKLVKQKKEKRKLLTITLIVLCCYGLTIHTRSVAIILSVIIGITIYRIIYKDLLVSKRMLVFSPVIYYLSDMLIKKVQRHVWNASDKTTLINSSIKIPDNFNPFSFFTWKEYGRVILGLIGSYSIFSFILGIAICIILANYLLTRVFTTVFVKKNNSVSKVDKYIVAVGTVFGICFTGTVLMQGLIWLPGVLEGISANKEVYSFKVYTYLRYAICYIGPIILAGIKCFPESEKIKSSIILASSLLVFWLINIMPFIGKTDTGTSPYFTFAWTTGQRLNDKPSELMYIISIHIAFLMLFAFCFFYYKKKLYVFVLLVNLVFIYRYMYFSLSYSIPNAIQQNAEVTNVIEYVNENINSTEEKLYVYDEKNRLHSLYQFYLREYQIQKFDYEVLDANYILSNAELVKTIKEYYTCIQLSEREYVYIKK